MRTLLILLLAAPLYAQDLTALGVKEFNLGNTEFNLGHYDKALEHFETSYRLTGRAALLYNIGFVEKALYDRTHDVEHLERALERWRNLVASTANDTDPKAVALRLRVIEQGKAAAAELQRVKSERAQGEAVLELGEELLRQGKLDAAAAQLDQFERTPGNERPGVQRAWKLRAGIAQARGDQPAAEAARAAAASLDKLAVAHTPQASLKPGAPVAMTFNVESDPAHLIDGIVVHYRTAGAYSLLPKAPVGRIQLPAMFSLRPGQKVEYFAEVVDAHGAILQHLGTADLPFAVAVETPRAPSVAKKWWFWTVTGVVVAGAAVGAGLGYYYSQPAPPLAVPIHTGIHSW